MSAARRWLSVAGDLLLGAACPGCEAPGIGLCDRCRRRIAASEPHRTVPTPCPPGFPETVTAGPYDELMHRLIPAHKEHQAWLLTAVLADLLAGAVDLLLTDGIWQGSRVTLVPVPSAPAAVRARGRDATAAIAAATARRLRRRTRRHVGMVKLLKPVRRVADQSELTARERQRNLAGAYAARTARIPGQPTVAVLVDDLVTTGSSLTEARRAVTAAGLPVLGAAVVAAAVRRHPPEPIG